MSTMFAVLLVSTAFVSNFAQEQEWSYSGETGPSNWPTLFPEFCSGDRQSPIDIIVSNTIFRTNLPTLVLNGYYQTLRDSEIENTGRTVEISPNSEETYSIEGGCLRNRYILDNIHFHWSCNDSQGSEHAINGQKYAMEGHFVHRNEKYNTAEEAAQFPDGLAVLAVFYKISPYPPQSAMAAITESLDDIRYADSSIEFDLGSAPVDSLLPTQTQRQQYFCYNGSLTTPNCNEAVTWTVFQNPQLITDRQAKAFCEILQSRSGEEEVKLVNNIRPLQPVNNRDIWRNFNIRL